MPKYWTEMRGGTWTNVDLVDNHNTLIANTAADRLRALAMSGDMALACTPATTGSSAAAVAAAIAGAAEKFTRTVTVTLKTAAGETHTWFTGTRALTIADDAAGAAAIADEADTVAFVAGVGTVVVEYTGTWVTGKISTLTVTGSTLLGHTIANATSVDTLVA
jgi:hypothetical protein